MKNIFRSMSISTHILLAAVTLAGWDARAQGSFQNLGFEGAAYPLVPDANGLVSASDAIPGWTPYIAGIAGNAVIYNNISLGTVEVGLFEDVFGTNRSVTILDGSYSVVLQAGFNGIGLVPAAVQQTGLIPLGTRSITIKAAGFLQPGTLEVDIAGQAVSLAAVSSTSTYIVYGGDISQFAGQTADLRIAAVPTSTSYANWIIDDIQFSASAIPEPSSVALLVIGAAMAAWRPAIRRR